MQESWKPISGYESKYEVSDLGNVRSLTRQVRSKGGYRIMQGKQLKQAVNHRGYSIIGLSTGTSVKTYTVHQLVALAFIPGFIKSTEINHDNGNKQDNRLSNLEISNSSHNQFHAVATGLRVKRNKSVYRNVYYTSNPRAKRRWFTCVRYLGKNIGYKSFFTEEEAARHADVLLDSIGDTQRVRNFP